MLRNDGAVCSTEREGFNDIFLLFNRAMFIKVRLADELRATR